MVIRARPAAVLAAGAALVCGACAALVGLEDKQAYPEDGGADVSSAFDAPDDAPDDGGADVVATGDLVASGQSGPFGIAVDSTYVYWTEETAGNVWRRAKDLSKAAELVASMQSAPRHILMDAQYMYWFNGNKPAMQAGGMNVSVPIMVRIARTATLPATPEPLYSASGTQGYLRTALYAGSTGPADDTMYAVSPSAVHRFSRSVAGAAEQCAPGAQLNSPSAVAADVDFVWWVNQGNFQTWRRLKTFSSNTNNPPLPQPYGPSLGVGVVDMTLDDKYLYYATIPGDVLAVAHGASYDGGLGADAAVLDSGSDAAVDAGPLTNLGHVGATPAAIEVYAGRLYLTRFTMNADGAVVVLDPANGGTNVVATGQRDPRDLAIDAPDGGPVTVYWTNHAEGTVRRVTVP